MLKMSNIKLQKMEIRGYLTGFGSDSRRNAATVK